MAPKQFTIMTVVVVVMLVMEVRGNSLRNNEDTTSSSSSSEGGGELKLTILHINDLHARFEETNIYSGRCTPRDKQKNNCFGGFA
ncbi:hypothetical protein Pcinc_017732, partial [Petrolisthes cinctipes]